MYCWPDYLSMIMRFADFCWGFTNSKTPFRSSTELSITLICPDLLLSKLDGGYQITFQLVLFENISTPTQNSWWPVLLTSITQTQNFLFPLWVCLLYCSWLVISPWSNAFLCRGHASFVLCATLKNMLWYALLLRWCWYALVLYCMARYCCGIVWYSIVSYSLVCCLMHCHGMEGVMGAEHRFEATVWYGWFGMAWFGMVWYGMVRHGMV